MSADGGTTGRLVALALLPAADLPPAAVALARLSLFDWMACGLGGAGEPLAAILRGLAAEEGGAPQAALFGGGRAPARMAALVNGAISHALDYDDTHFAHVGHPSVAIYPAALAAAELAGRTADEVAAAFLVGAEGSVRLGLVLGAAHYRRGFHQTATAGAFGATLAAGRLLGLDRGRMRAALGLCASRAAGVRAQFGTMGKPLNAGIAAAAGIECALLAARGFTAADDGLMGPQGFVATHAEDPDEARAWADPPPGRFLFEDIRYKLHACCHGTHAMIEGLSALGLGAGEVAALRLRTAPRWLSVCDIRAPRTGLEVKFSYAWLAAMVLTGRPTADDRAFTDALAADPALAAVAARVRVEGDPGLSDMQAQGTVALTDGRELAFAHDLARPVPPDLLAGRLRAKAAALAGTDRAAALWRAATGPGATAADLGALIAGG